MGAVKVEKVRREKDSLGEREVPAGVYWGIQTQRAVENFAFSTNTIPVGLIKALGRVKIAAARSNLDLELLEDKQARAIITSAEEVTEGRFNDQFPVDIFQTGSGTSSNMNMNEVIANRANEILGAELGKYSPVHPNDHVNLGQSSNDVFPTAIHLAVLETLEDRLFPALEKLRTALKGKAGELEKTVKLGRTHYQDAVPVTLGQEFSGFTRMIEKNLRRLENAGEALLEVPLGGTAVGTGLNSHYRFAGFAVEYIKEMTGLPIREANNHFEAQGAREGLLEISSALKNLAVSLRKIADDIRVIAAGPTGGPGEINLPQLQPGSSIMPGKVNPVLAEALAQISARVIGNDLGVTVGGFGGQLELNLMMPLMAHNILESIELLEKGCERFAEKCIRGITANPDRCRELAELSPGLATALVPKIGYDKAAALAQEAAKRKIRVKDLLAEKPFFSSQELKSLLEPLNLAFPHRGKKQEND